MKSKKNICIIALFVVVVFAIIVAVIAIIGNNVKDKEPIKSAGEDRETVNWGSHVFSTDEIRPEIEKETVYTYPETLGEANVDIIVDEEIAPDINGLVDEVSGKYPELAISVNPAPDLGNEADIGGNSIVVCRYEDMEAIKDTLGDIADFAGGGIYLSDAKHHYTGTGDISELVAGGDTIMSVSMFATLCDLGLLTENDENVRLCNNDYEALAYVDSGYCGYAVTSTYTAGCMVYRPADWYICTVAQINGADKDAVDTVYNMLLGW